MNLVWLLVALVLLLGNGFFVAAEFAAVSVRRAQIEPLAQTNRRARRVLDAQRRLSLLLAGAQLGITLCSLGLGAVAEPTVATIFEDLFEAVELPSSLSHPVAFAIALALVVLLHMVIGEMVPKNISLAASERAALVLVPALDSFVRATGPLIRVLNALANAGLRLFGVEPHDELKSAYTAEELADILAESRAEGYLGASEHRRLSSALSFSERTAADVAIALSSLVTVTTDTTAQQVEQLTAETGFSRFPVVEATATGRLLGFVHVKDLLSTGRGVASSADQGPAWALRHLHAMPRIAPDTPLPDVLTALRRARSHMGHVVDGGGSVGVVALEDVVEEFVGEISDSANG